jgi:hypothetical protein
MGLTTVSHQYLRHLCLIDVTRCTNPSAGSVSEMAMSCQVSATGSLSRNSAGPRDHLKKECFRSQVSTRFLNSFATSESY